MGKKRFELVPLRTAVIAGGCQPVPLRMPGIADGSGAKSRQIISNPCPLAVGSQLVALPKPLAQPLPLYTVTRRSTVTGAMVTVLQSASAARLKSAVAVSPGETVTVCVSWVL